MYKSIGMRIAAALLAAACALAGYAPCEAQGMPVVKDIEVRGLRRIAIDVVTARISQSLGDTLSPEGVSDDIKEIYELGYFEDVKAEIEGFEGGVRVIYVIKEKPAIRRVDFHGNEEVEDDKISERITISPGAIYDTVLVKSNADAIKLLYEEKGYPLAVVVPILRELGAGQVLLTYHVDEGPKVKIDDIEIEGNEELSDWKVKKAMKTSEWWIFSWLTGGGRYEKATLESDVISVRNLYFDEGFIQAAVAEPVTELSEDREWMDITLGVTEGERFTVSSVGFESNEVFTEEELMEAVKTRAGEVLSKKVLDRDVNVVTDMYSEKGYALATVFPDILPDEAARTAAIVFRIHEGDIYKVGRITISGNINTRDKVIRREVRLNEGETFNGKLLKRSYQRINNLNFFEKVGMKPSPHLETKTLDIDVEVEERSTGFLNVGVGYSSVDRFIGMVEVTQANLGGRGQYVKLKSEFGSRSTFYELSYKDPWFLDRDVTMTTSLYNTRREYPEYDKKSTGFTLGFGKNFKEYWFADVSYGYEKARIQNVDETSSDLLKSQEGESITSSVSAGLSRDTRDNYLDPHTGNHNSVNASLAGLGGDSKFYKVNLDSTWLLPVSENTHFSFRGRYGFAGGYDGKPLPLYERYYVGGGRTLRGLRSVGPRDPNDKYIGGKRRILFNVDYIFPLITEARLKGEIFYDIGTAFDSKIEMRDSAGVGIRWLSPIGPVKIDWARILDPEPGESKARWEFTIGTFF